MTDLLVPPDEIERLTGYKRPSRQVRIEPESVEAFTIYDAQALDQITVILRDKGAGNGGIIVACWSKVWACYWGAMGSMHIREFLLDCSPDYIVGKLATASSVKLKKADEKYLTRIVVAVQEALGMEVTQ